MKFSFYSFILATFIFAPSLVFSAVLNYVPLQPVTIPGGTNLYGPNILQFLVNLYTFTIALAGALAVIKIVWAGAKYMLSDVVTNKADSIKEIRASVFGLIVILGSYTLLETINPAFVKFNLNIGATSKISGDGRDLLDMAQGTTAMGGTGGARRDINAGAGSVLELMKNGQTFPDPALNDFALQKIKESGLLELSPSDSAKYFPNGVTAEGYLNLISSVAYKESSFNANDVYWESTMNKNSVGLLSLSADDPEVRRLGYSEQDLKDPYKNITAGVQIFKRTISAGGAINGGNKSGATAYWSTLR